MVLENPKTGHIREAPVGFSWTVLFFGFFPPLFRGDWKWFVLMILFSVLTANFSQLVFSFIYNKIYIKKLVYSGFKVKSLQYGTLDEVSKALGITLSALEAA